MEKQPSFDRSLLIPVGIGFISLIGICVILMMGRINSAEAEVEELPTATAFQYAFIGTEPAITTLTSVGIDEQELPTPTRGIPTSPAQLTPVVQVTNTSPPIITLPPLENTNTPTRTPTSESTAPFGPGTFDNTDGRFVYTGNWDSLTGVSGAYQSTLHVSGTLGNSVTFRFIGNELRVFFQGGPSLGTIRLTLDGANHDMPESRDSTQGEEWVLSTNTTGTHTVTISHLSGGSVNIDSIIVPVVPATPTNTSTSN